MKLPAVLVGLSLALGIAAGFAYRSSIESAIVDRHFLREIPRLPEAFARTTGAAFEFSLSALPQWETDPVLVDKSGAYPESRQYCHADRPQRATHASKDDEWHGYAVCNASTTLPRDFFHRPPYLHLSGKSYVMLALTTDPDRFGDPQWLSQHRAFLHVSELDEIARLGVQLTQEERLVAALDDDGLRALATETSLLIAGDYLLIGFLSGPQAAETTYRVYAMTAWRQFLAATPLITTPHQRGDICLAVVGSVCFSASPQGVQRRLNQATALGGSSVLLILAALVQIGIRRLRARRREQEARLFVLQTLSHEIRTPATSLTLSLEPIRRHFDELPEEVQPAFLRICDNVQRLQRVVEASKHYLRGQLTDRDMQFHRVQIPSTTEYLKGILESYDCDIGLQASMGSKLAFFDPYWVGVCIRNLIDNAIAHGSAPFAVRLSDRGDRLMISVEDGGRGSNLSLEQMTSPFCRGQQSDGLGFGLAVVNRLARAMGGSLRYESCPTRFTIELLGGVAR